MTKDEGNITRARTLRLRHSFVIRLPRRNCAKTGHWSFVISAKDAFSVVELIVVIAIILILAGLILATVGYVQNKGARSRAESEIAAISGALENYRADNGIYPTTANTNNLNARTATDPSTYLAASFDLYAALSGDTNGDRTFNTGDTKSYFSFTPNQLSPPPPLTGTVTGIRDPFGNSYGYSTAANPVANPTPAPSPSPVGYNPTFDLWSTAGYLPSSSTPAATPQGLWIKNW